MTEFNSKDYQRLSEAERLEIRQMMREDKPQLPILNPKYKTLIPSYKFIVCSSGCQNPVPVRKETPKNDTENDEGKAECKT